jgi:hypothetical protein
MMTIAPAAPSHMADRRDPDGQRSLALRRSAGTSFAAAPVAKVGGRSLAGAEGSGHGSWPLDERERSDAKQRGGPRNNVYIMAG